MYRDERRIAVVLPNGNEYSTRLMTGVMHFCDENIGYCPIEYRFTEEREDPLPRDLKSFAGAIIWADRGCRFVDRLVQDSIKTVNCCFDWQETAGIVSVGIDREVSCDLILAHVTSLSPRQFAVIGVNFAERPHAKYLCETLVQRATQEGLDSLLHEIVGEHPDEDRRRIIEVGNEARLLEFLKGLHPPAFVWCENDYVARMVCNAATFLGIAVPSQLAVMGSGDYRVSIHNSPTITTLPRPAVEAGYAAANLLAFWFANECEQPDDVCITPGPVIMRNSTVNSENWEVIRLARQLIEQEACSGLTVERICRRINLSKIAFTNRYREMFGNTPGAAISNEKAKRAIRLLRETRLSIADIGADLGFSEQSKFSKFFKRQTGKTPSEYRRSDA